MTTREKVLRNLGVPPHLARLTSEGTRHERLEALKEVERGGYPHRRDALGRSVRADEMRAHRPQARIDG